MKPAKPIDPRARRAVEAAAAIMRVPVGRIMGHDRRRRTTDARGVAILVSCRLGMSQSAVGFEFDREQDSVAERCATISRRMEADPLLQAAVTIVERQASERKC